MQVYLGRNGQQFGPYSITELQGMADIGQVEYTDYACCDGKNWIPVTEVVSFNMPTVAEEPACTEQFLSEGREFCYYLFLCLGYFLYLVGFLDGAAGTVGSKMDFTGVSWSPIAFCIAGAILHWISSLFR